MNVGAVIRRLRKSMKMTPEALADTAGTDAGDFFVLNFALDANNILRIIQIASRQPAQLLLSQGGGVVW